MELNLEKIQAKVQFVKDNLSLLRELAGYSEVEFVSDKIKFYAAVHALQVSIEALLDTFSHVISRQHLGAPRSDRETLEVALAKGLTTEDHFKRFIEMNKFRNKVVHGYLDVDAKRVYEMLQKDLGDFQLFFDDVKRIIENEPAGQENSKRKRTNSKK